MNAGAIVGFAVGVVVTAAVAWLVLNPQPIEPLACDSKGHYDLTTVTIAVKPDGVNVVAEPENCYVKPGQYVKWNFPQLADVQLRFGESKDGPTDPDRTPDEDYGLLFRSGTSLNKDRDLSIRIGPAGEKCETFTYFLKGPGGTWTPNPSIIIKPDNVERCDGEPES